MLDFSGIVRLALIQVDHGSLLTLSLGHKEDMPPQRQFVIRLFWHFTRLIMGNAAVANTQISTMSPSSSIAHST